MPVASTAKVAEMWRYPVKSLRGQRLRGASISHRGLPDDRRWAIRDRVSDLVLSAKREPRLFQARATVHDGQALIETDAGTVFHAADPDIERELGGWLDRQVTLEDSTAPGSTDPYFDAHPVHLLTTASLRWAHSITPASVWDVRRFRPNLLIDVPGEHRPEPEWVGRHLLIGEVELAVVSGTGRCRMTSRRQADLHEDPAIQRTVNDHAAGELGVYAVVVTPGRIEVGDRCELL